MSRLYDTDKRRYLRYEVLDYALCESPQWTSQVNAVITDIGLGGLQLRMKDSPISGTICRILVGRFGLSPLGLRGEIRHVKPIDDTELVSVGVRFVPESHEERMAIAEYVHGIFQRQCDLLAM